MKKQVDWDELNALTESQKDRLRKMWQPERGQGIAVPMCQDVENEVYAYDTYVIKSIIVNSINEDKRYGLSRYPVKDYEYHEVIFEAIPIQQSNWGSECEAEFEDEIEEVGEEAGEEEGTGDEAQPLCLINKETCLPELDITIMLELLEREKVTTGFALQVNPDSNWCRVNGFEFEGDCLCDILWQGLQKLL